MNKNVLGVIAAVVLLAGCGRDEEPAPQAPPPPATPPTGVPAEPPPPTMPGEPASPQPGEPGAPPAVPPGETPATPQSEAPAMPQGEAAAPPADAPAVAAGGDAALGESVYKRTCALCHAAGVAGAPKPGDKEDWSPRIAQGMDVLYNHSLNGFQGQKGVMPPKGGNTSLPDDDVRAAVEYMVAQSR